MIHDECQPPQHGGCQHGLSGCPKGHDPLCYAASPDHFPSVTITGEPFPCDCPLIDRVHDRLREEVQAQREQFMRVTHTSPEHPMARIYDEFLALLGGEPSDYPRDSREAEAIEEYHRAQWGWGNFLILDDYDGPDGRPAEEEKK